MPVIPSATLGQIEFCEAHLPVWTVTPTAIGLTTAQVLLLGTLTTNARKEYNDALAARDASKAATTTMHDTAGQMRSQAADMVRSIKTFAEASANPGIVYGAAQIPPPAAPTPAPAPGQPTNLSVTLEPSGAITLRFKATNAAPSAGTFFSVRRKLAGQNVFTLIGNSGEKFFTDATIPQTTPTATYILQGHRGGLSGPESEQVTVQFGIGGPVIINAELKMAA